MIRHESRHHLRILFLIMSAMFIYYAAATLFNTKGEPREAIVALSMIKSGNWILPESFGTDIPYKPPFMAWCIAGISLLFGGNVTEFTSRLPSMIAAMVLVLTTCRFFSRKIGDQHIGFITAFITLTSVEVFRTATACRVDMLLTMFIVVALYSLYSWLSCGCKRLPWLAIAMMTGGVLTKGPVGMILPCLCIWIYGLMVTDRRISLTIKLAVSALSACIVPAIWYVAAAEVGGDSFIALMLEENVGRFTGSMSYGSHENPIYYNFITLLAGMAPYTLLGVIALFFIRRGKIAGRIKMPHTRALTQFALTAATVILIFYCIPKSKRSVYLLPMYPFLSYFVTLLIYKLNERGRGIAVRIFIAILAGIGIIAGIGYFAIAFGMLDGVKGFGQLGFTQNWCEKIIFSLIAIFTVFAGIAAMRGNITIDEQLSRLILTVSATMILINTAFLPTILSEKSDKYIADYILVNNSKNRPVYNYVATPMLRFYTTGFYTSDGVKTVEHDRPSDIIADSWLIVGEKDFELLRENPALHSLKFHTLIKGTKKSCDTRQIPMLVEVTAR